MLVSAITLFNSHAVSNLGNKTKETNMYNEKTTAKTHLDSYKEDEQSNIFDIINEWKNFCHRQIAQGKFDIIA